MGVISFVSGLAKTIQQSSFAWARYMNPIVDVSKDATANDHSQVFVGGAIEDDNEYKLYYSGQSHNLGNVDRVFLATHPKNNGLSSGWSKYVDGSNKPIAVFSPGVSTNFDGLQVWFRTVLKENGIYKAWYIGEKNPDHIHKVGYATSNDGITWTRYQTTPIYEDPLTNNGRVVVCRVINDVEYGKYRMLYCSDDPEVSGLYLAESTDGITGWTRTHANLLDDQDLIYMGDFKKIGNYYYIWSPRISRGGTSYGPAEELACYRTTDFVTFDNLGAQMYWKGASELGVGMNVVLEKPDGKYFTVLTATKAQIEVNANGGEQFSCIKYAELNRSDIPLSNATNKYSYPSYVAKHYPLNSQHYSNLSYNEVITGELASINTAPSFVVLEFTSLNGSQVITCPNNGSINPSHFGIKVRISITTTGTHELFRVGNDILMTLENGYLRVRLSSDGISYQKDYISTAVISKPAGILYVDNHIWVGFTFNNGVLKLYNDFVEFSTTKTVDGALSIINNSNTSMLPGQNATLEMRSLSVLSAPTDQQLIDLEI